MKKKFLLIELLVVVLLLSILGVVMIPKFLDSQEGALVAQAKYELHLIGKGMKQYNHDHGRYPNRNGMMTNPRLYDELIRGNYVDQDRLKDPFLGPEDVTNDGDPSIYFWADMKFDGYKYQHYSLTTNQYRGALPGSYLYNLGSTGPDKVINLDNPPPFYLDNTIRTRISIVADRELTQNEVKRSNASLSNSIFQTTMTETVFEKLSNYVRPDNESVVEFNSLNSTNITHSQPIQETVINRPISRIQSNGVTIQGSYPSSWSQYHIFIDYDPTNGINSVGDIHHLGPE